jgi:hypothetical protein
VFEDARSTQVNVWAECDYCGWTTNKFRLFLTQTESRMASLDRLEEVQMLAKHHGVHNPWDEWIA